MQPEPYVDCGHDLDAYQRQGERLRLAKLALVETGYFTEAQVSDDVAPRIVELEAHRRRELAQARADVERLVRERDEWRRAAEAEAQGNAPAVITALTEQANRAQAEAVAAIVQRDGAADRHRRLGIELDHWRQVIVPEIQTERDHLAETARRLTVERDEAAKRIAYLDEHHEAVMAERDTAQRHADELRADRDEALDLATKMRRQRDDAEEQYHAVAADRDRLADTVRRVREQHVPKPCPSGCLHCAQCGTKHAWPCPTAEALGDAGQVPAVGESGSNVGDDDVHL